MKISKYAKKANGLKTSAIRLIKKGKVKYILSLSISKGSWKDSNGNSHSFGSYIMKDIDFTARIFVLGRLKFNFVSMSEDALNATK